jgi:hypothetical protein
LVVFLMSVSLHGRAEEEGEAVPEKEGEDPFLFLNSDDLAETDS